MKIAFIHYHFKTGGVATVIKQQIAALKEDCEILVLTGETPPDDFPYDAAVIPEISYDNELNSKQNPEMTAEAIVRHIRKKWPEGCDILHSHNPTLAKNKHFLSILKCLQRRGIRMFIQIHDFSEDGRPGAYFKEGYPDNVHYGVINSRDYHILKQCGLKEEGLHLIANVVNKPDENGKEAEKKSHVLYPVRAIRRKNIGEAIFLSLFFKENMPLVITLPPNSPKDKMSYDGWRAFSQQHGMNVIYEAGLSGDFGHLVRSSAFILTTSISEGFGFSFLEPWLFGKMLRGRKIPAICEDFEIHGVDLSSLYERLWVPVDWVGKEALYERFLHFWKAACESYGVMVDASFFEKAILEITRKNRIDFGFLDEMFQKKILLRVLSDKRSLEEIKDLNPFLTDLGETIEDDELISRNKGRILQNYTMALYRETLMDIYDNVKQKDVVHSILKDKLLSYFLNPCQFHLLKWGDYV